MVLLSMNLFSQQQYQTIRGRVVDADSRESLPGAAVVLLQSEPLKGTTTDINGQFRLERIPPGRHSLRVSFMGYKEALIPEITVITGKETILDIALVQSVIQMQGVEISASQQDKDKALNTMASISARKINMDDATRYAGGFNDAARMVSNFAGVATIDGDGVNDIIIRGNSPRGLLWRLEGIEIPNPNHFTDGQGSTGGAMSVITSNVLATSDFLTAAFPAEFGNAYSGVMDLYLRKGNDEKYEYAFQLGLVGTEMSVEGPLCRKAGSSFLVNYRYSTFGLLSRMKMVDLGDNNLPPVFQDLVVKLTLPSARAGIFSLFAVAGHSTTGTDPVKDSIHWIGREGRFFETEDHRMGTAGLKHVFPFADKKTTLKTTIAATFLQDQWESGILDTRYNPFTEYSDDFSYPALKGSLVLNSKRNAKNTVGAGLIINHQFYHMFLKRFNGSQYDTTVDTEGSTSSVQVYSQWKHRFSDATEASAGIHILHFAMNGETSLEPRLGMKWNVNRRSAISAGIGLHSRMEAIPVYTALVKTDGAQVQANRKLGLGKAMHAVLGFDHSLAHDWRFKTEVYYQFLYRVPVEDRDSSNISSLNYLYGVPEAKLNNRGKGRNLGIEATIEKFYTGDYYLLLTLSLFDSRYKAMDQVWHNTAFNGNYVVNILLGKDFKLGRNKQHLFGLNMKCFMRGGNRIPPIDHEQSRLEQEVIYDYSRIYEDRLPDFFRNDLGCYLRINRKHLSYIITLDIQNITGRQNTIGYAYSRATQDVVPEEGMGLLPILNFRMEF